MKYLTFPALVTSSCPPSGQSFLPGYLIPRVLVTGGSGFIGSHLVDALLDEGFRVRVFDSLETGYIQYLNVSHPRLELLVGSILDLDAVRKAVDGVSGVFHLAAASKVAPSLKDPLMATVNVQVNGIGTANLLQMCVEMGSVTRFVYAASSTYYGNQKVPFSETDPFVPSSPYAASKFMGELLTLTYDKVFNLPSINLRFFMVYGPRQPTTGGYAIVTGKFMQQYSSGEHLTVQGIGDQFRDFIHISDIVRGLILAFHSEARGVTINLGSGEKYSVQEVADMISLNQTRLPARPHDLQGTLANTSLAESLLGFRTEKRFVNETLKMKKTANETYINPFWTSNKTISLLTAIIPGYLGMSLDDQNEKIRSTIHQLGLSAFLQYLM